MKSNSESYASTAASSPPGRRHAGPPIYLDHAAATPLRPEVREAMEPLLSGLFGNPSSVHRWGRAAREHLEDARERTAAALGTAPSTVRFVRGGTESVNLAILGTIEPALGETRTQSASSGGPLLFRSSVEHAAVRESVAEAEALGCEVYVLPVSPYGRIDLPDARKVARRKPALASVQWVNQETGTVLPIEEVGEWARDAGVPLHVDAVQGVGKLPLDLRRVPISLLSVSGHKLGGPKGTGVLVVREGARLHPRLFGGGQEGGVRPGTEDVAGAVGFACALEVAVSALGGEMERLRRLRDRLEAAIVQRLPGVRVHGGEGPRAPHISNLGVPGLPRDLLPSALDLAGVGVSAGSACRSGSVEVSPVLRALYGDDEAARVAPLRLSVGWPTTEAEVDEAASRIGDVVTRARDT
jgi:cysteine desulfurase